MEPNYPHELPPELQERAARARATIKRLLGPPLRRWQRALRVERMVLAWMVFRRVLLPRLLRWQRFLRAEAQHAARVRCVEAQLGGLAELVEGPRVSRETSSRSGPTPGGAKCYADHFSPIVTRPVLGDSRQELHRAMFGTDVPRRRARRGARGGGR